MPNPWIIVGSLGAAIGIALGAFLFGMNVKDTAWQAKVEAERADAAVRAIQRTRIYQEGINNALREQNENLILIGRKYTATIRLLQKRQARIPEVARADCQGTTGAELSRPDGTFLAREATRADRLRAALKACYAYADSLQEEVAD